MAPPREHAELLLRKASRDEFVFDRLANDPECSDEVLGFHVQQAAEKMLKAALALRRIRHPRTHDLPPLPFRTAAGYRRPLRRNSPGVSTGMESLPRK